MTGGAAREEQAPLTGTRFWKMTGSGNDFVVIDARHGMPPGIDAPDAIAALCSRTDGVGADGVVFIERHPSNAFAIRYYNRDGSRGELCGNASLCSASLAVRMGLAGKGAFSFNTDIGAVRAAVADGTPEISLAPVQSLRPDVPIPIAPGERRIGFADTGVPHLVVLVDDTSTVDVPGRGSELRRHPSLEHGANVNFVSKGPAGWRLRTYERGVEAETRACGTGSVATAALLVAWRLASPGPTAIITSSGRTLTPSIPAMAGDPTSLRGEGRVVFEGTIADLWPAR